MAKNVCTTPALCKYMRPLMGALMGVLVGLVVHGSISCTDCFILGSATATAVTGGILGLGLALFLNRDMYRKERE